jgi:uncharacterized protein
MEIKHNKKKAYSVYGNPAKGCKYCVKGEKLVLFITGLCAQRCSFCPVSELKFGKDDVYANEWKIKSIKDLYKEIELTKARGTGITGGDPLVTLDKTCRYIKLLKKKYGKQFHIHLYTPFKLVNELSLKSLYESGLDEIRFHPNLDDESEWNNINFALKYKWDIGIEIPCLPNFNKIKKCIDYFHNKVKFFNLNELELSDTIVNHYNPKNYKTKNNQSYAVKGSLETAKQILDYVQKNKFKSSVYFCSAFLKDRIQMGNRILRRAKGSAKKYDIITDEGMLVRGSIYLNELKPSLNYRKNLETVNKKEIIKKLTLLKKSLNFECDVDKNKLRIICSAINVEKNSKKIKNLGLIPAIVEEYPTNDAIEIEVDFI